MTIASLMSLGEAERIIYFTFNPDAAPEKQNRIRLTLKALDVTELGGYREILAEVDPFIKSKGIKSARELGVERGTPEYAAYLESGDASEYNRLFLTGVSRAYMLATLTKLELHTDGDWAISAWPESWSDIDSFTSDIPPMLYEKWQDTAIALNPEVFLSSDEGKARFFSASE